MAVYRFEMRQLRVYTVIWSMTLALIIFMMLPVYLGFISLIPAGNGTASVFESNAFFEVIGVNMKYILTPMGMYGFLNGFVLLAGAIGGTYLGMRIFVKEYMHHTADFLMTKQYGREFIYIAKQGAALTCSFLISLSYTAGSFCAVALNIPGYDLKEFLLLTSSFFLIQMIFVLLGSLAGVVFPYVRTPLTFSCAVAFTLFVLGIFARKMGNPVLKLFSPFVYFDNVYIYENGGYPMHYVQIFISLCLLFSISGRLVFSRRDILPFS